MATSRPFAFDFSKDDSISDVQGIIHSEPGDPYHDRKHSSAYRWKPDHCQLDFDPGYSEYKRHQT